MRAKGVVISAGSASESSIATPPSADAVERSAVSVELAGVSHRFGEVEVLTGVDLRVEPGSTTAIVGPSGSGKSTLLELVAGLQTETAGRLVVGSESDAAGRLRQSAYMPQRDLLLPWLRAIDNAALALRLDGQRREQARAAAHPLLERLGLAGFENARPGELSGGMRQRVAFARTLLSGKPLLLLDEPFAALDALTRADLQEWLVDALSEVPRTVLLVTHDVEEALFVADRVLVLSERPGRVLLEEPAPARGATRTETVTSGGFVAARERALARLGAGPT